MPGSTAPMPYETRRAVGARPFFSAHPASDTTTAAAPLLSPGELPAVIVPSLRKAGFSLARLSRVVSGRLCSSLEKVSGPFLPLIVTGTISLVELARRLGRRKTLLRPFGPAVLVLAGNLAGFHQVLGVPARVLVGKGVVQAVAQHAVVDLRVTHAVAPAPAAHEVGRRVHILHAAGDRAVDHAEHDLLGGRGDRLRAGTADAVHRHGRCFDR